MMEIYRTGCNIKVLIITEPIDRKYRKVPVEISAIFKVISADKAEQFGIRIGFPARR